ncbi:MAG TPA: toll/interleukin-1 receptor domain-containing protein, partial [Rhizomicrobium sp.]|nr:toll/interleukin-1 receptor domain-containing protein [Rhizomicrobium sp.]
MVDQLYRYRAFISYRHTPRDRKWARWLIERLETYRTPRALVRAGAPSRIGHLYRDDDEVPASSDLSHEIENSLRESQFLIVVCSPDTPKSKWVHKEIEFFRSLGRGDRILALLVEGEPGESFPPDLLRVPVETTRADGSRETEWIEHEPIASDVRPRRDERRSATERRAFLRIAAGLLGVRYDDLVQREHQRRLRRGRIWAAAMLTAAAAIGGGLFEYWDYNTLHTRYYAAYGRRWAAPLGIGEISGEEASHRDVSYAIDTLRGKVAEMRIENGSHALIPLDSGDTSGEPWDAGAAVWKISFEGDRVSTIKVEDSSKQPIRTEHYEFVRDGHAAVETIGDTQGGALALSAGASDLDAEKYSTTSKSDITRFLIEFTPDGEIGKRLFQKTEFGIPARDSNGNFGRSYAYDALGHVISIRALDEKGRPLTEKTGIAELRFAYAPSGALVLMRYIGANGRGIVSPQGYSQLALDYDERGDTVGLRYLGPDGRAALRRDTGIAAVTTKLD